MTTPPTNDHQDQPSPPHLDYKVPPPKKNLIASGCLSLSIVFAFFTGAISLIAILFLASNSYPVAALLLAAGITIVILGAIFAKKHGLSAAVAIVVAATCAILLMWSICGSNPIRI